MFIIYNTKGLHKILGKSKRVTFILREGNFYPLRELTWNDPKPR